MRQSSSVRVFKLGSSLKCISGCPRQNQFSLDQFELRYGNRDIVLCELEEPAGVDDRVGNRLIGGDDEVVYFADAWPLLIEDWRAEIFAFGAPAKSDVAHLGRRNSNESRTRNLRPRDRRRDQGQARDNQKM